MSEHARHRALADDVAAIIVNYATPELTLRAVESLSSERRSLPNLKVIVVEGGSPDRSAELLAAALKADRFEGWVTFLPLPLNGGFGWANNQAILRLAGEPRPPELIYLLNPDAEIRPNAAAELVKELQRHPDCGAVGSQLLSAEGTPTASAFRFPSAGREMIAGAQSERLGGLLHIPTAVIQSEQSLEVDWVTGASVMFRTAALQAAGLFDDGFFLYFDEVELLHRMRSKGWTVRYVPRSLVMHAEGASTGLGAATAAKPHPAYWYRSRRRYFGLTGGWPAIVGAGLGALAGQSIASVKGLVGGRRVAQACRARDLLRFGLRPRPSDVRPSAPAWGDAPGRAPAWMTFPS